MDILTIVAGIIIGFIVAKNVIFHKKNNRERNRQIITISAVLTIVFNIVSYFIYKKIGISLNYSNPYFYFNELLFYYIIRFFVQFILSHQLTIFHFVLQVLMLFLFHLDNFSYH